MDLKELLFFTVKDILNSLSEFGKDCFKHRMIIKFLFKSYVQDLIQDLNKKFDSETSNQAYHRELLLRILLYCSTIH